MKYAKHIITAAAIFVSVGIIGAYTMKNSAQKNISCSGNSCCANSYDIERYQTDRDKEAIEKLLAQNLAAKESTNFTLEKLAPYLDCVEQKFTQAPLDELNKIEDEKMRKMMIDRWSSIADQEHPLITANEAHVLRVANKTVGFICSALSTIQKPQKLIMQTIVIIGAAEVDQAMVLINHVVNHGKEKKAMMVTATCHKDDALQAKAFEAAGFIKAGVNGSFCAYMKQLGEMTPAAPETPADDSCVIHLSKDTFEAVIAQSKVPVIIDIYASWCPPCRALAPIIEKLAHEHQGTYLFAKVDVDKEPTIAQKYGATKLPTLIFIKGNEVKGTSVGLLTKDDLTEKIKKLLN